MTRRAWLLVDVLSRALTPDEREAVRGDLEEAGETGVSAVREVLGLVLRRQAATWMDWRPWIAVGTIVAPVGVALSHLSAFWAGGTAIYSWLYIDNWDASLFLSNPVLIDDILYGLSERASGRFFALDARTGRVLWLGPPRQATNSAIVKADHLLFLLNDNAELIVARASRNGFEPLTRYTVAPSATWAQPAISGGRLFVKDTSSITLWTFE